MIVEPSIKQTFLVFPEHPTWMAL